MILVHYDPFWRIARGRAKIVNVIKKCLYKNQELPKMLQVLEKSGNQFFYNENMYLDLDGIYKEISN